MDKSWTISMDKSWKVWTKLDNMDKSWTIWTKFGKIVTISTKQTKVGKFDKSQTELDSTFISFKILSKDRKLCKYMNAATTF